MVGRLNLPHVCEGDALDMSCRAERGLDSPDSGLPPSPSAWLLPPGCADKAGGVSPGAVDDGRGSRVGSEHYCTKLLLPGLRKGLRELPQEPTTNCCRIFLVNPRRFRNLKSDLENLAHARVKCSMDLFMVLSRSKLVLSTLTSHPP